MSFVTKIDYSDNRQIKQFELTNTQLSGSTEFGVPFSGLSGVLDSSVVVTSTVTGVTSTFSGNSTTTNITFSDSRLLSGSQGLYAITDTTSGDTQMGYGFYGVDPYELDGNILYNSYTGSSYDFQVTSIEHIAFETFTGESISNVVTILSGSSNDYTDRTIWVDVLGITKTKRLILDDEPDEFSGATHVLTRGLSGDVHNFPISGFTGEDTNDYVSGATFNTSDGILTLGRISGGTVTVDLDGRYLTSETDSQTLIYTPSTGDLEISNGNIVNLDGRYSLTGHTHDISEITSFTDNSSNWNSAYDDTITGMTVTGTVTKTITLTQRDGGTITADFVDGSGGSGGSGDVVTGMTFNSGSGLLTLSTLSGDTITENLDGRYSLTGHTHASDNTDDYVSGGTFNAGTGDLDLDMLSGDTVTINLDGRYLTSETDSQTLAFSASTGDLEISNGNIVNLDGRYLQTVDNIPNTDDYVDTANFNISNGVLTLGRVSGGTVTEDLDGRYLLIDDITPNTDDYVTSMGFNTGNGILTLGMLSGGTVTEDLDGRYSLDTHTHASDNTDDYVTSANFNISTGVLTLGMLSGGTVTEDLDGRYLQSSDVVPNTDDYVNSANFNISNGILTLGMLSGGTVSEDLDGRYSLDTHTHVSDNTDDYIDSANFNTSTGVLTLGLLSGGTVTENLDGRYLQTDDVIPNTDNYIVSANFDTNNGILTLGMLSGGTVTEDLDGRYLTSETDSQTLAFSASTGDLEISNGNIVNLDGRYSPTGHTHDEFGDFLPLTGGTLTGPVTGTTFNVDNSQLDYQENLVVDSVSTEIIATVSVLEHKAIFFDYVVSESTNIRAGTVMTTFMGSTTVFTDNSTTDIGDTSGVMFSTDISGTNLRLLADTTTDGWEIKVMIRAL